MTAVFDQGTNPFFTASTLPYEIPPFAAITVEYFRPAFERGMADQLAEVAAIATSTEPATFANTVLALECGGRILDRVSRVFYLLTSADTSEAIQEIETEYAPKLSAHFDQILLNRDLFARIDAVHAARDALDLDAEDRRLLERYHTDYVRAGAALTPDGQRRLSELNTELATLTTQFGKFLLADTNDSALLVADAAELDGLSADAISTAAEAARARGLEGYLLTLILPTHQPALELLTRRSTRRRLLAASMGRGRRGNAWDTTGIIRRLVLLRAERAALLGYATHSDYVLADRTAQTNQAVDDMLHQLIPAAVRNARREEADLAAAMAADPAAADQTEEGPFAAWDWAYYAQVVKRECYDFDTATLRPYFELERTLVDGVFWAAEQLYGITFTRRDDLVTFHAEAVAYEVHNADGSPLGLFIRDYFTRDSKRGGAWMSSLVTQSDLLGQLPVVHNIMNIPRPPPGQPALLGLDEVGTMFHEFGHALHGLFSAVRYPRLAGTAVARDFVEYPSQVNEMWMTWPPVLEHYSHHIDTGEALSSDLVARMDAAATFNEGFQTVAYLGASWIDLCWHRLSTEEAVAVTDIDRFEREALEGIGLRVSSVPPRYSSSYFNHIFAGGYSAGYYSYIWSEVLDADTVQWFTERGGLDRATGGEFRSCLLSRGGTAPEMSYFEAFRGRAPRIEPLLERRGLVTP